MVGGVNSVSQNYSTTPVTGRIMKVPASQDGPVTPVPRVPKVAAERLEPLVYQVPQAKEGADPKEMAVRSRIGTGTEEVQLKSQLADAKGNLADADLEIQEERVDHKGETECECCKNRKYVDGSDDASVSFQTPGHISPEASATEVMAHEQEHVTNERMYAAREGKEVLSQNVALYQSTCPECGISYTSGGLTTTVTAEKKQPEPVENKISLSSKAVDQLMAVSGA